MLAIGRLTLAAEGESANQVFHLLLHCRPIEVTLDILNSLGGAKMPTA